MKKQKDGRYKSRVVVGKRRDGTNIVKYISGKTKKELEEARQRVLAEYRDGAVPDNKYLLANDYIMRWYDTCAAPKMKKTVADQKRRRIEIYIEPWLRDKALKAVSAFDLQEIVNAVDKGRTVQQNVISVLRGAFRAAYSQGLTERDITASLRVRLRAHTARRAFTEYESKGIEENLSERRTEPLIVSLLYYAGMRRGEMLALRWSDVDLKSEVLHVTKSLNFQTGAIEGTKTAAGVRDIPICAELNAILAERQGIGNTLIIQGERGRPIKEMAFRRRWAHIQREIFDGNEEITPHYFRHNYATRLYDAGVDVLTASKVLGHSDPATTLRIYTDISNSRRVSDGSEAVKRAFENKK